MYEKYKNSYKVTEKELVSLSVYNVGFQRCDSLYQWGPGIRDHYLIHYIISGKGFYKIGKRTYELQAGDSFLVYPNTEVVYYAAETDPWEYAWVGFTGSDASMILRQRIFRRKNRSYGRHRTEVISTARYSIFTMPEEMNLSMPWK